MENLGHLDLQALAVLLELSELREPKEPKANKGSEASQEHLVRLDREVPWGTRVQQV